MAKNKSKEVGVSVTNKKLSITAFIVAGILCAVAYTQLTIFVIQPIGALPEGKTLVIARLNKTEFVDSADAMCERIEGEVNLMCRIFVLGAVINKSTIYLRLPYSEWLYLISTGGKNYEQ